MASRLLTTLSIEVLLTHLPSCAFVQPHSTSLQRMAKADTLTLVCKNAYIGLFFRGAVARWGGALDAAGLLVWRRNFTTCEPPG